MVIVAAVDRSEKRELVAKEAESLAEAFNEEIHVVHVLSRSEFVNLERTNVDETGTSLSIDQVREIAEEYAAEAQNQLEKPSKAIGLMGEPAERITAYAKEHDARYVVVSGRKRSPTGKVIFGSVSQSILLNASSPVVSVVTQ
jgi:nucleotide-binding universal stress UspA family protein